MSADALIYNFRAARVAVLENSKFSFSIVRTMLAGFGFHEIKSYSSPEDAAEGLLFAPADIFLCDPFPAGRRTFDMLGSLREPRYGEVSMSPVLVVTANVNIDLVKSAQNSKVDFVVAKPFSARVLLDRIIWCARKDERRNSLTLPSVLVSGAEEGEVELW